jgi:hypothetical protein
MPTKQFLTAVAFIVLVLGLRPITLRADSFSWTDVGAGITSASGTLTATSVGNGEYIVDSGTATFNGDSMTLVAGTDDGSIQTSPSGLFLFDNVLLLSSDPVLDVDGLLFADSLGTELNIWGNGTPGSYSTYIGAAGSYPLQDTTSTFSIVPTLPTPEPSALVLLVVGLLAFTGLAWRATQKNTLAEVRRPSPRL